MIIRRTFAALTLSGAMLLGAVSTQAASAAPSARPAGLCSGIKSLSKTPTSLNASKAAMKQLDGIYAEMQSKAPGSAKKYIVAMRKYFKVISKLNPKDPNYVKKLQQLDTTKLAKSSAAFNKWATTYIVKKCHFDPNKLSSGTTG